jgi:hypothetical protein
MSELGLYALKKDLYSISAQRMAKSSKKQIYIYKNVSVRLSVTSNLRK